VWTQHRQDLVQVQANVLTTTSYSSTPTKQEVRETEREEKKAAKAVPPKPEPSGGGLSMKAVWDSQAERRADEKAAADAARAKTRVVSAPGAVTDGSDAALQVMRDSVTAAEARRAEEAKAAQEARPEEPVKEDPFRAKDEPADPFGPNPAAPAWQPRVSPGVQTYQANTRPPEAESGSAMDGRF